MQVTLCDPYLSGLEAFAWKRYTNGRLVTTYVPMSEPVNCVSCVLQPNVSKSRSSATTFTLLVVSFYLIFTTLPVTVCYALYLSFPEGDPSLTDPDARAADPVWRRHIIYNNIRTVVEEIGLSHYACNFYIYLLTGKVFRRQLRRLLCRSPNPPAARW